MHLTSLWQATYNKQKRTTPLKMQTNSVRMPNMKLISRIFFPDPELITLTLDLPMIEFKGFSENNFAPPPQSTPCLKLVQEPHQ